MRGAWLAVLLALVWSCAQAGEPAPREVRLVSEHWLDHSNRDGSGLAWDLMREVFEPAGVKVSWRSEPYLRSIGLVQRGEADAWLGAYRDEIREQVIYPQHPYDADRIMALGLADHPLPKLDELGSWRLAWMRGYAFQDYLPGPLDFTEIERRGGVLAMLERGHMDFYIDASTEIDELLAKHPEQAERFRTHALMNLPLYAGFADTARGRALVELFDRRMAELLANGELRLIFQRWHQPYPFE